MTLDLLRFTTAGSVDDGKSTLIGRLLYDTKQVFEDQLEHVEEASRRRGGEGTFDLALLTDGLRAEREQGITIDVAYRYFATPKRRFIIADCPGHQQYTRNMVTGASTADLAVILLDARHGVLEQSRRHAFISALLGIPHLVVAVNKMDLVDYSQARFDELTEEFSGFTHRLNGVRDIAFIPMSALNGDNVVDRSEHMGWYQGPTLLELLEQVEVAYDHPYDRPARFPVQWVIRPTVSAGSSASASSGADNSTSSGAGDSTGRGADGSTGSAANGSARSGENVSASAGTGTLVSDYRGYAGQLASGALRVHDEVVVLPGGQRTRIAAIDTYDGELEEAIAPVSLTLRLEDELDVSRGETICRPDEAPSVARELEADVCWMASSPLRPGGRYRLKHTARTVTAIVDQLQDLVEVDTLERSPTPSALELNDIGRVRLRTSAPLAFDSYRENRRTGSFILIDESSNETVGAGMIVAQAS
ncbi:MAG TPA: GTP-binding protein [Solirubrobacteraceae bacterium]|nr:GTP-binding protein [Solirubrobacteraceae bacterium]